MSSVDERRQRFLKAAQDLLPPGSMITSSHPARAAAGNCWVYLVVDILPDGGPHSDGYVGLRVLTWSTGFPHVVSKCFPISDFIQFVIRWVGAAVGQIKSWYKVTPRNGHAKV